MRTITHPLNVLPFTPQAVGLAFLILVGLTLGSSSQAWAQTRCSCVETLPFGACAATISNDAAAKEFGSYPDQFPGSMTMVDTTIFVADLFSGRAHQFRFLNSSIQFIEGTVLSPVPGTTTGIASRTNEEGSALFWAGGGKLYRSDIDGNNAGEVGTIQLEELAVFLRGELGDDSLTTGEIGDIVYHPTRDTFWGVDIVNDVYFEFDENGALNQPDGTPVHFVNPRRNSMAGGAYGNSITYAAVNGEEFFDIPVGSLPDGAPSEVLRVFATETESHRIGGDTGIFYPLGAALGSPGFITGIGYVQDVCNEAQNVELIFEINAQGTTRPQLIGVSADPPTAASVANFACTSDGGGVSLSWNKTLPYTSLEIRRRATDADDDDEGQVVFTGSDFAADPEMAIDASVPGGSYVYSASVTVEAGELPPSSCSLTIGLGSATAFRRVARNEAGDEPFPFGIAIAENTVVVADVLSGDATTYDLDLNPLGTIDGPFDSGLTVGIAYNSSNQSLFWLQNTEGMHTLQATDTTGMPVGDAVLIELPANLDTMSLGDLTYDATGDIFWSVDLISNSVLAFGADGSTGQQLPQPSGAEKLSGGIALTSREEDTVVLDLTLRQIGSSLPNAITRSVYNVNTAENLSDLFSVDLGASVKSGDASGIALITVDDIQFEFLVSQNRSGIYKLELGSASGVSLVVFQRGDANDDGDVNISDPSFLLNVLFQGGATPPCADAADADNSETMDITDAIFLFDFLFRGGGRPPAPFGRCGLDAEPDLTCESATCAATPDEDGSMGGETDEPMTPADTDGEPAA